MTAPSIQPAPARDSPQGVFAAARGGAERLPVLRQVLEQTSAACTDEVRNVASMPLRLTLASIEAGTFEDVLAPGQGDSAIALLNASAWDAQLFLCADRAAVFVIVEAMLGGDGSQPAHAEERVLSRLEVDVAGVFFAALARALAASFAPVAASPFNIEAAGDAVDLETVAHETAAVIAKYRLEGLERGGELLLAIPQSALEALRKPLSQAAPKAAPRPDPGWTQQISKELTRANVTLTAILEERAGMLAEVFSLAVGQVIELKATPQSRVRVECNGEPLMWCDLGKSNGAYTLRVDSFIDREREFMDDILAA